MYDQAGGGFHRYSTDAVWLVPHFEKMLYDNALLARAYLDAYRLTGDAFYRRITEETLDYVLREMTDAARRLLLDPGRRLRGRGGQVLPLDARRARRGPRARSAELVAAYYGVTDARQLRGRATSSTCSMRPALDDAGSRPEASSAAKAKLYEAREQRVHPGLDDKVLTPGTA